MQGQTQSSLAIWTAFNNLTTASSRQVRWLLKIAWTRVTNSGVFATIGTSIVGGSQFIQGLESIATGTDTFNYFDETDRAIRLEFDRTLEEPLGGIAKCIADVRMDNTDQRFTPNNNSTIGTAILPNRPIQIAIGFVVSSVDKLVYVFKGITKQPRENKLNRTVDIVCYDYLEYLNEFEMDAQYYTDDRSDVIIEDILSQAGIGTSQYDLDEGLNTVSFGYFEQGQTALTRIRKICEAEEAIFYQDENGILKFENRRHSRISPHSTPVWDLEPDDIILWELDEASRIINRAIVVVEPRAVQATEEVWRQAGEVVLDRGETLEIFAQFQDPVTSITTPVATTDYTAFSETGGAGTNLTTDLAIVTTLFTTTALLELTNNGTSKMYINLLKLRGTPAEVTGSYRKTYEDSASITKYQAQQLEIRNPYIDEESFAQYIAKAIVSKYSEPRRKIKLRVQGIPQLQLRDMVRVRDLDVVETESVSQLTGTNGAGFGEIAGVVYRGQGFKVTDRGKLKSIWFQLNSVGTKGLKVYFYKGDSNSIPTGGELYSFVIHNTDLSTSFKEYQLPVALDVIKGQQYTMYFAPWNTTTDAYADDYRDIRWQNSNVYADGKAIVYQSGAWAVSDSGNLDLKMQIDVDVPQYKNYRVMRIQGVLEEGLFYQDLYLREVVSSETDAWAIVGTTQIGSESEFVGI